MSKVLAVLLMCALPLTYSMEADDTALLQASAKTGGTPQEMIDNHESERQSLYELPSPLKGPKSHKQQFRVSSKSAVRAPSPFLRIFDPEFFLLHKQAHWGPFVSCQHGGGLDVESATECENAAKAMGLGDRFAISEEGFNEEPSSRCQLRNHSAHNSKHANVVWYGDEVWIGEQFCGENETSCVCAADVQPICEKNNETFCTDGWATEHDQYDCDGDGLADRLCLDTAFRKAGFLSSLNNCANNFPAFVGRCSAVTTGVWPQQQCAPFEHCEPQSALATLAKGMVKIDLAVKDLTGKKLGVGFYSPETTDPVACVSLGKPTGSLPSMPEGCTFCAFQQFWQMNWGRGTRAPTHMLSMTCNQKNRLTFSELQKEAWSTLANKISPKAKDYNACPAGRHLLASAAYVVCDGQQWCPSFVDQCCMTERNGCSDFLVPYFSPANVTNATAESTTAEPAAPAESTTAEPAAADDATPAEPATDEATTAAPATDEATIAAPATDEATTAAPATDGSVRSLKRHSVI